MRILGFMGSPRSRGLCAQFTESVLKGAASKGAEIMQYNLVKCTIHHCTGCHSCVYTHHELPVGRCPLEDDMAAMLEDYLASDGYILSSPVYDFTVTSIMKAFIERRFPLFRKNKDEHGKVPDARVKQGFMKKASLLATGDAGDEYAVIADPCFEVMSGHFMIEEIDVIESRYIGNIHAVDEERYRKIMDETFAMGVKLVEEIARARA